MSEQIRKGVAPRGANVASKWGVATISRWSRGNDADRAHFAVGAGWNPTREPGTQNPDQAVGARGEGQFARGESPHRAGFRAENYLLENPYRATRAYAAVGPGPVGVLGGGGGSSIWMRLFLMA